MSERKIYVVGHGKGYASWMQGRIVDRMEDADLVVLTGGEDVDPRMYGAPRHPKTYANLKRDLFEHHAYVEAQKLGKPVIGICRGLQLMCIENGGTLIQHQDNPGHHKITTYDGNELYVNSLHHQAAYPYDLPRGDYHILGWTRGMLRVHQDGNEKELNPEREIEIIYFPKSKSLGIQFHPEMMETSSETVKYCQRLLTLFLKNKLLVNATTTEEDEDIQYYAG